MPGSRSEAFPWPQYSWAAKPLRRLKRFRLRLAIPSPHANDGDSLLAAVRVRSKARALGALKALGVSPEPIAPAPPPADFEKQQAKIPCAPHLAQPGWTLAAGVPAFVWFAPGRLTLTLSGADGNFYAVSRQDIDNALALEKALSRLELEWIDPPSDSDLCLCPKYYPRFWA